MLNTLYASARNCRPIPQASHVDPAIEIITHRSRATIHTAIDECSLLRISEGYHGIGLARVERAVLDPGREFEQLVHVAVYERHIFNFFELDGPSDLRTDGIANRCGDLGHTRANLADRSW